MIAQAQKIIPYKPTAGVGGMPGQPTQGGVPQNAMPGQPPPQGGGQQPPLNLIGQLLLNRAGMTLPGSQPQMNPLQTAQADYLRSSC